MMTTTSLATTSLLLLLLLLCTHPINASATTTHRRPSHRRQLRKMRVTPMPTDLATPPPPVASPIQRFFTLSPVAEPTQAPVPRIRTLAPIGNGNNNEEEETDDDGVSVTPPVSNPQDEATSMPQAALVTSAPVAATTSNPEVPASTRAPQATAVKTRAPTVSPTVQPTSAAPTENPTQSPIQSVVVVLLPNVTIAARTSTPNVLVDGVQTVWSTVLDTPVQAVLLLEPNASRRSLQEQSVEYLVGAWTSRKATSIPYFSTDALEQYLTEREIAVEAISINQVADPPIIPASESSERVTSTTRFKIGMSLMSVAVGGAFVLGVFWWMRRVPKDVNKTPQLIRPVDYNHSNTDAYHHYRPSTTPKTAVMILHDLGSRNDDDDSVEPTPPPPFYCHSEDDASMADFSLAAATKDWKCYTRTTPYTRKVPDASTTTRAVSPTVSTTPVYTPIVREEETRRVVSFKEDDDDNNTANDNASVFTYRNVGADASVYTLETHSEFDPVVTPNYAYHSRLQGPDLVLGQAHSFDDLHPVHRVSSSLRTASSYDEGSYRQRRTADLPFDELDREAWKKFRFRSHENNGSQPTDEQECDAQDLQGFEMELNSIPTTMPTKDHYNNTSESFKTHHISILAPTPKQQPRTMQRTPATMPLTPPAQYDEY